MKESIQIFFLAIVLSIGFVACNSGTEEIEKIPAIANKYDSTKPTSVTGIIPSYGIIDEDFIVEGNFPGKLEDMKVYFGDKGRYLYQLMERVSPDLYRNKVMVITQYRS